MRLITFILSVVLFAACKHGPEKPPEDKFVMTDTMMNRCQFTKAKMENVRDQLKLFGKIAADNSRLAQVYPVMGGSVIKINVELGDRVKQGDVLAVVRSGDVAELKKEKLDAASNLAVAEKNLNVQRDLFAGKLTSEKDVIAAEKELEKAKAEVARLDEVFGIFQLNGSATYNITAPISGYIVFKDINQNELLRNDKSGVVFSIAEIDEVWALANVNESDIAKIHEGYEAEVQTIAYPNEVFKGKVDRIFNAIDPETKAMKALVKIKNNDLKLKPEMNATVILNFTEDQKMVAVPSSAVIFDKSKNWVMVFKDREHIETRRIQVYHQLSDICYISSGLQEGETVISKNALLIYDALND